MDRLKKILQWLIPLLLGLLLFWLVYRKMDLKAIGDILSLGLNWQWVAVYFLFFLLPMILRGLRWKQLIDPVCPGGRTLDVILSVFIAYGANLLFPRIGEVARCGTLRRYNGLNFSKTLGTVVTERAFDILCLLLMALAALVLQIDVFRDFLRENPDTASRLVGKLFSWKLWTIVAAVAAGIVVALRVLRRRPVWQKVAGFFRQLWEGMLSIRTVRHPLLFIAYTIGIWGTYFLSFYVGQFFFHISFGLGLAAMFTAYVMGSFGVVAPVQGGIGAWHFMVIFTLTFYGIGQVEAGTFAFTVHGLNTLLTIVCGLAAWAWVAAAYRIRARKSGQPSAV